MTTVYDFDAFRLAIREGELTFRGSPVRLTAKAVAVLTLLAERAPQVVSRAEFEAAVWPDGFIEPANLTQTIYMLRRALGRFGAPAPIETVNGRGYRLTGRVIRRDVSAAFDLHRNLSAASDRRLRFDWRVVASLALLFALAALLGASRIAYALHPQSVVPSTARAAHGVLSAQAAPAKPL
jgi:DNA-binding winged helix-turn-helix (wHTH) protein